MRVGFSRRDHDGARSDRPDDVTIHAPVHLDGLSSPRSSAVTPYATGS